MLIFILKLQGKKCKMQKSIPSTREKMTMQNLKIFQAYIFVIPA